LARDSGRILAFDPLLSSEVRSGRRARLVVGGLKVFQRAADADLTARRLERDRATGTGPEFSKRHARLIAKGGRKDSC